MTGAAIGAFMGISAAMAGAAASANVPKPIMTARFMGAPSTAENPRNPLTVISLLQGQVV
jgi:hypothetical protein